MGAVKQVQTLYIAQRHNDPEFYNNAIYIFEHTPLAADVTSTSSINNHCSTGYLEGLISCGTTLSGQYIVIVLVNQN